jgi:hypothetical protein
LESIFLYTDFYFLKQQYSTHLHTNSTQNTENGTYITIKRKKVEKCGPCLFFATYTLEFALQQKKKHGKTSVRVVEKRPEIPVAVDIPIRQQQ